ncbi:Chromatin structure-remodeling complex protein rsc9 [Apophysomyces sp. BC1034]|nr:Chromatin structure-remodeling complex protein rsc9 [Apophysomyces sp. BC1015]KAG0174385.1 Chromatin structure-remodeling complex protein rsc9 [Apophysomyces sp. BC1021]KAG0185769.1 Chromatin structure-remodeling complex protein rsc9 [Apophysomyces sp. BC1034]
MDEEFRSRILLALQSTLPNEVDWAFNTLVKFSFASENFSLDYMPILVDILLKCAEPFFQEKILPLLSDNENSDGVREAGEKIFNSKEYQEEFERVLQVFHILRNFSFLEINIRRLAHHERLRHMLMMGIALPPSSQYAELSRHCLDILENIAPQVIVTSAVDPYIVAMSFLLFTNDRALTLGAIRSLTRVAVTEINERHLGMANPPILQRMTQFLLVDDEELAAATLEYFYQYSGLHGNFAVQLVSQYPGNLIGLLTGFLSYKSTLAPSSTSVNETIHGIAAAQLTNGKPKTQAPTIPDLTNYAHLDEPYRCLGWLKEKLLGASLEDKLALKDIYLKYQTLFGAEKPLGVKEFYTVLKIAFPQPPAVEAAASTGSTPLDTLMLQNIKYAPPKKPEGISCQWKECIENFENDELLHKHILVEHIPATADEENNDSHHSCQWMSCTRNGFVNRATMIQHLRTHFSVASKQRPKKRNEFMVGKIPVDESEVSGVPLTAALLLRNLVKYKQHHEYYLPYEKELTLLAIQRPKLSKYILAALAELEIS